MINTLDVKNSILFNFDFLTILFDHVFTLIYLLIHAVLAKMFNLIAELAILIETKNKERNAEIKIHPVIVEAKIRSVQHNLEFLKSFHAFSSSIHFVLFVYGNNFLFHLNFLI